MPGVSTRIHRRSRWIQRLAFDRHAAYFGDAAYGALRDFAGGTWRAIFCDSLEVEANLFWCDDFREEFSARRGYDLTPFLPILKIPGFLDGNQGGETPLYEMGPLSAQVRSDYHAVTANLIRERFYEPFIEWAHAHALQARVQAHGAPADVERIYGLADIPETETLYDDGAPDFLRLAGAAADIYGRAIVGAEAFVHGGNPYAVTPQDLKREVDRLILAGVNETVFHGAPYPYAAPASPAIASTKMQWFPFLPPTAFTTFFDPSNPFWPYLSLFNAYITRLQTMSRQGRTIAQVAVYRSELSTAEGTQVLRTSGMDVALTQAGYMYGQINADALSRCRIRNGMLCTPGEAEFAVLVLAHADILGESVAEQLAAWANAGFPVLVFGGIPARNDRYTVGGVPDRTVQRCMTEVLREGSAGTYCSPPSTVWQTRWTPPSSAWEGCRRGARSASSEPCTCR